MKTECKQAQILFGKKNTDSRKLFPEADIIKML
jgi:hypothetical protein